MSALVGKSIIQLRAIAQGHGISDIFAKDELQLIQAIEMKQRDMAPSPIVDIPRPSYDARLMSRAPAKKFDEPDLMTLLQPYIERGLNFAVIDNGECWQMTLGKKVDTGSMRSKPMIVVKCAERLLA